MNSDSPDLKPGLAPLVPFDALTVDAQGQWRSFAKRCYSNSMANSESKAEALYYECDGDFSVFSELADQSSADSFVAAYTGAPVACIEWYPVGKVPGHRSYLLDGSFQCYPVPVLVRVNGFKPSTETAKQGRFWYTHIYHYRGKALSYHAYLRAASADGAPVDPDSAFHFGDDPKRCYLVEVFVTEEFESLDYQLQGIALMTLEQLGKYLVRITRADFSPYQARFQQIMEEHLRKKVNQEPTIDHDRYDGNGRERHTR